jgi:hypothetical protein
MAYHTVKHPMTVIETDYLMLYREIMADCFEIHKIYRNSVGKTWSF